VADNHRLVKPPSRQTTQLDCQQVSQTYLLLLIIIIIIIISQQNPFMLMRSQLQISWFDRRLVSTLKDIFDIELIQQRHLYISSCFLASL